jgi:uncharacterized protein
VATDVVAERGLKPAGKVRQRIIDTDMHPHCPEYGLASVVEYMTEDWREHFNAKPNAPTDVRSLRLVHPAGVGIRTDPISPKGGRPSSDPEFVAEDLLDGWGVDIALMNMIDAGYLAAAVAQPGESVAICEAFNRYFIERWVETDSRYRYIFCVTPQDIEAAVEEVKRIGKHPGVAGILVPPTDMALGRRWFWPLLRIAEEYDLPIYSHFSGVEMVYQGGAVGVVGTPESYLEKRAMLPGIAQGNIASLLFSGAMTKFPGLKVCFAEYGWAWLGPFLSLMDDHWRSARIETPWLKTPPSEVVRARMRFSTQPMPGGSKEQLKQMLDLVGTDLLMFATDYPHFDNDPPVLHFSEFEESKRDDVFFHNAERFFTRLI